MNLLNWKKEIKLQYRKNIHDTWKDLYVVVFEATDYGTVNISYVDRQKLTGGGIVHTTRTLNELIRGNKGLRMIGRF